MARSRRFEARLRMWCSRCRRWIVVPEDRLWDDTCPICDRKVPTRRCTRCGYEWYPRSMERLPLYCADPCCGSPYWNREQLHPTDRRILRHAPIPDAERREGDAPDSMVSAQPVRMDVAVRRLEER